MSFYGQMFCSGDIKYAGQPYGLVVANSQHLAHQAALRVKVEYSNVRKPLIDLREVIASGDVKCISSENGPEKKPQGKHAAFISVIHVVIQ
jgi:xanthine dehydrogenase molybdopterin-binding subunit B